MRNPSSSLAVSTLGLLLLAAVAAPATPKPLPAADLRFVSLKPGSFPHASDLPVDQSEARVDRSANRLIFTGNDVHVWMEYDPEGARATFRVGGLTNPEIQIVQGARLTVTLVSLDPVGPASFDITRQAPPFSASPDGTIPWSEYRTARMHPLGPRQGDVVFDAVIVFEARSPGQAYYFSPAAGAATIGMYGRIVVVP